MSKSDHSEFSRVNMTDSADDIALKNRRARTDPAPLPDSPEGVEGRPEAANLVGIYAALADRPTAEVCAEFAGGAFAGFKARLTELMVASLGPIGR